MSGTSESPIGFMGLVYLYLNETIKEFSHVGKYIIIHGSVMGMSFPSC